MFRTVLLAVLVSTLCALPASSAEPLLRESEPSLPPAPAARRAAGDVTLEIFDFDTPAGDPDPQGWQSVDLLESTPNHWHVDDASGLPSGYQSMLPSRRLWCGVRPEQASSSWPTPPGYGNGWNDVVQSVTFAAEGPVAMAFTVGYDLEANYDYLYLEARIGLDAPWQVLRSYTGTSDPFTDFVAVTDNPVPTPVTLRFRVETDFNGSDEDGAYDSRGAAVLDDIHIATDSDPDFAFEDFEDEPVGAQASDDGFWSAAPWQTSTLGNRGALVDGTTVLQEDPSGPNQTNFWSFYEGSTDTYRCGEIPSQPAVPLCTDPVDPGIENSLGNDLYSPWIALDDGTVDFTILSRVGLGFHLYLDNPPDDAVFYLPLVRWRVNGVDEVEWTTGSFFYYGTSKTWIFRSFEYDIPDGATHVQVGIRVMDAGYLFDPSGVPEKCHPHSPLVDDVVVSLLPEEPIVVTSGENSGAGTLREAIELANADPGLSRIHFDLPGPAYSVVASSSLPDFTAPVIVDGTTQPGYSGTPLARIGGQSGPFGGSPGGMGIADDSVVRGLSIVGFSSGLTVNGSGNVIENCWFGIRPDGSSGGNSRGVLFDTGASDNRLGSDESGMENRFEGNFDDIVLDATAGTGNDLRGNVFTGTGPPAVDLGRDGRTPNDPLDADTGPNGLQNYPEISDVDGARGLVYGQLPGQPNTTYTVDFYRGASCYEYGNGGAQWFTTISLSTDASGTAGFVLDVGGPLPVGESVLAIATAPDGSTSEFSPCRAVPEVIEVTNTDDDGTGSLRRAIDEVNQGNHDFPPRIEFAIPGPGPHRIENQSALPRILEPVILDATAHPSAVVNPDPAPLAIAARPAIELDGSQQVFGSGLVLEADGIVVRGLAVGNYPNAGIAILGRNAAVEGCFLGTDATGEVARPNGVGLIAGQFQGDVLLARVGGPRPDQRNLVSGNAGAGLQLTGDYVAVDGNLVGPSASLLPLGNAGHGVVAQAYRTTLGHVTQNVFAFNAGAGVRAYDSGFSEHEIRGNLHYGNSGLGIDRLASGPTVESNGVSLVPVVQSVDTALDEVVVALEVDGAELLFLYVSLACHPSGYGEGSGLLATVLLDPLATGPRTVSVPVPFDLQGGEFLTATVETDDFGTSEFGPCFEILNTPVGQEVLVNLAPEPSTAVSLSFAEVTGSGNTEATPETDPPALPDGYLIGPAAFDLSTDATFTGPVEICVDYDPQDLGSSGEYAAVLHYDEVDGVWEDITTSVDAAAHQVCGVTDSFSPFAVASRVSVTGNDPAPILRPDLSGARPNPFNPRTTLSFVIDRDEHVRLEVFDLGGRRVRTLLDAEYPAGRHEVLWDGRDASGAVVSSGVYLYRVETDSWSESRKMTLLR